MDILTSFFNWIASNFQNLLSWVIELLPNSPFQAINNADVSSLLGGINWVFPIAQMVAELQVWLIAVGIYYLYQIILRWIKAQS